MYVPSGCCLLRHVVYLLLYRVGPVKANSSSVGYPIQESLGQAAQPDSVTDQDIPGFVDMIRTNNKKWSKLAVRLKVSMKKISEIRSKYPHAHDEACKAMLRTWIAETTNPLTKPDLERLILEL